MNQLITIAVTLLPLSVYALEPLPKETGTSGYLIVGAGAVSMQTNTIAGTRFNEIADSSIDDLGAASSTSYGQAILSGEVKYTWAETQTQVFVGNILEDRLRYDLKQQAGIRQQISTVGLFGVSATYSGLEINVWEDPFDTSGERSDTRRISNGYEVTWDRIFKSPFQISYESTEVDIQDESSGESLLSADFTVEDQAMLDRNGRMDEIEVSVLLPLAKGHLLVPQLVYTDDQRDGEAMSNQRVGAQLTYIYKNLPWTWVTNAQYSSAEYDQVNPVFDTSQDTVSYGFTSNLYYEEPFEMKDWKALLSIAYYEEDSDIDFYDSEVNSVNLGMMYFF
ncbi:hypothetical protein SIN8267_03182 [Sinobacterium norvegicum]|uniref:DUF2860 domain-containing protein n=1 Tax=Sinobacterium norvegicum TaxID=1641715 RepID=A0ABM9AIJ5_9GAMM|nr:DUF2860 family protein [Sinobacterium norvegicum]CAH0993043.1 hypothetical protein SIN8267_03182 [Sinobacterium norvegicum]